MSCDEIFLAKKVGHRFIGVAFEGSSTESAYAGQSLGASVMVQAMDMRWEDDGYRDAGSRL